MAWVRLGASSVCSIDVDVVNDDGQWSVVVEAVHRYRVVSAVQSSSGLKT